MIKYRVEILQDGVWKKYSSHIKDVDAIAKADKINQIRKISVRVMYKYKIVMAYYIGEKE